MGGLPLDRADEVRPDMRSAIHWRPTRAGPIAGLLAGLALWLAALPAAADEVWQLASRDADPETGFELYITRSDDADPLRYRLETAFPASAREAADAVVAVTTKQRFAAKGQTRRILSRSENGILLYTRVEMPMMVADRDVAIAVKETTDDATGAVRVSWHAVVDDPALPPLAPDTVRMTVAEGYWAFEPDGPGRCHATYVNRTHPGGALPRWLTDPMLRDQMTEDAQRVRAFIAARATAVGAGPPDTDAD